MNPIVNPSQMIATGMYLRAWNDVPARAEIFMTYPPRFDDAKVIGDFPMYDLATFYKMDKEVEGVGGQKVLVLEGMVHSALSGLVGRGFGTAAWRGYHAIERTGIEHGADFAVIVEQGRGIYTTKSGKEKPVTSVDAVFFSYKR